MKRLFRFIFMLCVSLMLISCSKSYSIIKEGTHRYSKDGYYRLVSGVTDDNIRFYLHDSKFYLDNTFEKPVATLYQEKDGDYTTEFRGKTYEFSADDLKVLELVWK